jgi:cupin 2 domain-containing protein
VHTAGNILTHLPDAPQEEIFETLVESGSVKIERIVSRGQITPEGEWFDQERDEWVMVIAGSAELQFEEDTTAQRLNAGDFVTIPARCRHRVTWTDPAVHTVWLAVHFMSDRTP